MPARGRRTSQLSKRIVKRTIHAMIPECSGEMFSATSGGIRLVQFQRLACIGSEVPEVSKPVREGGEMSDAVCSAELRWDPSLY